MASLAFNWVSVSWKRARTLVRSANKPSWVMPAAFRLSSTRAVVAAASSLRVALPLDIWAAGTSP